MVKCTSVGEIEEEDGTITVAHPSSIVMTTYFMGLGHYTIVMGGLSGAHALLLWELGESDFLAPP
ncbi:hypothetical protein F2Q69_00053571 [Brassica cretica]|uniref:Uncharacterized protein n=1 Tax=Brassica cretica TaxID=69181 RepID=A0A8S9MW96_BRACR|nr:hypothetical protein F2Q69_00053571 [Brassica cretica]